MGKSAFGTISNELILSGQTAEDFVIFDGTDWVAKGGTELRKVSSFTRDVSLSTGTQAVTGVGFKPSYILFHAVINATPSMSVGMDDGTDQLALRNNHDISADTFGLNAGRSISLIVGSGSDTYAGDISTFDSDGFTIQWTKFGSPTGTATIHFTAFR